VGRKNLVPHREEKSSPDEPTQAYKGERESKSAERERERERMPVWTLFLIEKKSLR
jgi:hypothetical protein